MMMMKFDRKLRTCQDKLKLNCISNILQTSLG